jgi:hypothetical protein
VTARRLRCSVAAELAGDPMEATAPPADRWLLVEHAGPWGRHAITESNLDPVVAAELVRWTRTHRARVGLIRRPGAPHRTLKTGRWYLADARPGREAIRTGWYSAETQLLDVLGEPAPGEPSEEPIYLVCTHGRHDTCCALRGRPVADALARAFPERTWECTHIGGDRFAANLVVLPHGLYYGRLQPQHALEVVNLHESGHVDPRWLRGRSSMVAPAQAAQHHARQAGGDTRIDAYRVLSCEPQQQGEWLVCMVGDGGGPVEVTVRAWLHDAGRPLTCSATHPDRFRMFDVRWVRGGLVDP